MVTKVKLLDSAVAIPSAATGTTQSASDNSTKLATTAYVTTAIANLSDSAPSTLNTLNELAAALGDDANFSTTVTNSIATKLPLTGGTLTGGLTMSVSPTINNARLLVQRANDDSSITFANNASGTPSSHTWAIGLDYSANNGLAIAYANNGIPSLTGSNLVQIDTTGNVGIGSASPEKNLSIGSAQAEGIQFNYDATNNYRNQILNYWNSNTDSRMDFNIARTSGQTPETIMSIGYGGKVGIGTTSPASLLSVQGDGFGIRIDGTANTSRGLLLRSTGTAEGQIQTDGNMHFIQEDAGKYMRFSTANTERMRINTTGDVGIGTDNPASAKLCVSGAKTQSGGAPIGNVLIADTTSLAQGVGGGITLQGVYHSGGSITGLASIEAFKENATHNQYGGTFIIKTREDQGSMRENLKVSSTGAVTFARAYTFPTSDGSSGHVLKTDGSGSLSFGAISGGPTHIEGGTNFSSSILIGGNSTGTLSSATDNTGLGIGVFAALTSGIRCTAIGTQAGASITTASEATLIGRLAGNGLTTGNSNTYVGGRSGLVATEGSENTGVGQASLFSLTTGSYNTAIGRGALLSNTTASNNTAVGRNSLNVNTTGENNVAVGNVSLDANSTASNNTAVGYSALGANTTGAENTAVGKSAMIVNTTGYENVAVGVNALDANTTGYRNTAIGHKALTGNTTGLENTVVGQNAGASISTSSYNVLIGQNAGSAITVGPGNVCIGVNAGDGLNSSNGKWNVAIGLGALSATSAMFQNTAVGQGALAKNTSHACTSVGSKSLEDNTSGGGNNALGYFALNECTTGDNNVALGSLAGRYISTGDDNICIGVGAANTLTTGNDNIIIGQGADSDQAGASNQILISTVAGNTKGSNTGFIQPSTGGVYQGNNSSSWSTTSDRRIKKNIEDNNVGLDAITNIRVRNFEYRTEDEITEVGSSAAIEKEGIQVGVIAQEVETILPDIVKEESTGVLSVNPDNITWYLVNAVKELSSQVNELKQEIENLKGE